MAKTFELVSFELCPYVQRSVIMLKRKKIDFKLTLIDLENPPEWFEKLSPLGKVPLLLVRESGSSEPTVLFESAIINEYLDEITPPALLPSDPLEKARERAWIVAGGELLMSLYTLMTSKDRAELDETRSELWDTLTRLESTFAGGNFFNGKTFGLVDAAFAPVWMRVLMMRSLRDDSHWKSLPKTRHWAEELLKLPEVQTSVPADLKAKYSTYLKTYSPSAAADIQ